MSYLLKYILGGNLWGGGDHASDDIVSLKNGKNTEFINIGFSENPIVV